MRTPNKRSRSKSNRPKPMGNIVNRVFDSSGPEGKVRGTPQQIIDKYQTLARDAQLSGDRVASENFLQHAEHYTRMLNEAQREMAREAEARREQQGGQQPGGQQNGHNAGQHNGHNTRQNNRPNDQHAAQPSGYQPADGDDTAHRRDQRQGDGSDTDQHAARRPDQGQSDPVHAGAQQGGAASRRRPQTGTQGKAVDAEDASDSAVIDIAEDAGTGLVETPEGRESQPPADAAAAQDHAEAPKAEKADTPEQAAGDAPVEQPKPKRASTRAPRSASTAAPRAAAPRAPRKPRAKAGDGEQTGADSKKAPDAAE
ncbi:MAG: DUF4167 domain-containing protein [Pararhodobacter sp.]